MAVRLAVHGRSSLVPKKEVAARLQPWLQTQGMYLMNAYSVVKVLTFRGLYWPITVLRGPLVGFFEKKFLKKESCPENRAAP